MGPPLSFNRALFRKAAHLISRFLGSSGLSAGRCLDKQRQNSNLPPKNPYLITRRPPDPLESKKIHPPWLCEQKPKKTLLKLCHQNSQNLSEAQLSRSRFRKPPYTLSEPILFFDRDPKFCEMMAGK